MDITNKDLKSSSKQVIEKAFNDIYQEYKLLVFLLVLIFKKTGKFF